MSGFENAYDKSSCTQQTQAAAALTTTNQVVVGVTVLLSSTTSLMNMSSMSGLWIIINQFQVFTMLLFISQFLPVDIRMYITGVNVLQFSFKFMQFYNIYIFR